MICFTQRSKKSTPSTYKCAGTCSFQFEVTVVLSEPNVAEASICIYKETSSSRLNVTLSNLAEMRKRYFGGDISRRAWYGNENNIIINWEYFNYDKEEIDEKAPISYLSIGPHGPSLTTRML